MTLELCINNAVRDNDITPEQGQQSLDLFNELRDELGQRMSQEEANRVAGQQTFDAIQNIVMHRKRQRIKAYQVQKRIDNDLRGYKDWKGQSNLPAAAKALFYYDNFSKYSSVEDRRQAVLNFSTRYMSDVLATFRKNVIGGTRNKAKLNNMIREVFGENTGDASARELAEGWRQAAEYLRQRFNAAGGRILKRLDWGMPQDHDILRVRQVPREEWIDFVLPKLNIEKMVDESTGLPFSQERLRLVLADVYETITTDGFSKRAPGKVQRGSSLANRRTDHRFLVFDGANNWLAYQKRFGNADPFDTMMGHLSSMSRDVALLEILGPNPAATLDFIKSKLRGEAQLAKDPKALEDANRAIYAMEVAYMAQVGQRESPVHAPIANFLAGTRQVITSSFLGGAVLSAVSDLNFQRLARSMSGLKETNIINDYIKQLNPLKSEERSKIAIRTGLIAEGWMTVAAAQMRYIGDITGPEITRRLADSILKISGLSPFTNAGRWAFGLEFFGTLADNVGKTFDELDPALKSRFEAYNIGSDKWDIMRSTELFDYKGAKFLIPENIEFRQDINPVLARDLATKYMEMVNAETNFAVPSSSDRGRNTLVGKSQPGTIPGELTRSFAMFKNFGVTILSTYVARGRGKQGFGNKSVFFADFLISTTLMGALAWQMKEMTKGRDTQPMTDFKFWLAAFLQGGGVGILGDFLFSDANRYGGGLGETVAGPVVGLANDLKKLTRGNIQELAGGKDTNAAREFIDFTARYAPGNNIWYIRLAFERLVLDRLRVWADPKAARKIRNLERRIKRERGQDYWWRPGRDKPGRLPDLGNILSEAP